MTTEVRCQWKVNRVGPDGLPLECGISLYTTSALVDLTRFRFNKALCRDHFLIALEQEQDKENDAPNP